MMVTKKWRVIWILVSIYAGAEFGGTPWGLAVRADLQRGGRLRGQHPLPAPPGMVTIKFKSELPSFME